MKKSALYIVIIAITLFATSCVPLNEMEQSQKNLIPLTDQLIKEKNLEKRLKRTQVYNANDLVLEKNHVFHSTNVVDGKIVDIDSLKKNQVIIHAGTEGEIMGFPKNGQMTVCFSEDPTLLLTFELRNDDKFHLLYFQEKATDGQSYPRIKYGNDKFWVMSGDDWLNVDKDSLLFKDTQTKVEKGRKVK